MRSSSAKLIAVAGGLASLGWWSLLLSSSASVGVASAKPLWARGDAGPHGDGGVASLFARSHAAAAGGGRARDILGGMVKRSVSGMRPTSTGSDAETLERRDGGGDEDEDSERLKAVRDSFLWNWRNYEKYAWGKDFLNPLQRNGSDDVALGGFGATIVDSLSTWYILGLTDDPSFKRCIEFVKTINFKNSTQPEVSVFELSIRYIGGLISAYQLGGAKPEQQFLLDKAQELADSLSFAWYQGSVLPWNRWNLNARTPADANDDTTNMAQAGTLSLEWATLSQYTKNDTYYKLVNQSTTALIKSETVLPGLYGQKLGVKDASHKDKYVTPGGGTDSFMEYLIKFPLMLGVEGTPEEAAFRTYVDSAFKFLLGKSGVNNYTFLGDYDGEKKTQVYLFSHLACFHGGTLAMAGRLLNRDDWTQTGLELAESCARVASHTAMGITPYAWGWYDRDDRVRGWDFVSAGRKEKYQQSGFFITVPSYVHGPEVIESLFYGYRITGNSLFRDLAWQQFQQMDKYLHSDNGWIGVVSVEDLSSVVYDQQMSFLYSELYAYLGLLYSKSSVFSLDDYVFNTEGHPLRTRPKPQGWSPIQGRFPYQPISTAAVNATTASSSSSSSGSSSSSNVVTPKELASQVSGMPKDVASNLLSKLPSKNTVTPPTVAMRKFRGL